MDKGRERDELPAVAQQFLHELSAVRRLSPLSVAAYRRDLLHLNRLAEGRALSDLTAPDVRRAAGRLHAQGMAAASIARMLSAWRTFFRYLAAQGASSSNPALGVRGPRRPQRLPKALAPDQAVALASQKAEGLLAVRDHAIVELLYSTGLRLSELVALDLQPYPADRSRQASLGWIDLPERELTVTGKGSKRRSVPIGQFAVDALRTWLSARPTLAGEAERALFVSTRGTPGAWRARSPARAAPFDGFASAAVQRRSARGAGDARAREHLDHTGLHAS
jgi:integrase/recombinase XerC